MSILKTTLSFVSSLSIDVDHNIELSLFNIYMHKGDIAMTLYNRRYIAYNRYMDIVCISLSLIVNRFLLFFFFLFIAITKTFFKDYRSTKNYRMFIVIIKKYIYIYLLYIKKKKKNSFFIQN